MTLYCVILHSPSDEAWANVRREWPAPQHLFLDDRVAFISTDNVLTADVMKQVGIEEGSDFSGLVIQMDYFNGRGSRNMVEWLNKYG